VCKAGAAAGPDAPDRYAKPGANFSVGHRRVGNEQGKQSLRGQGQAAERLVQCVTALRQEQVVLGGRGPNGPWIFLRPSPAPTPSGGAPGPEAFPPGAGGR